MHAFVCRSSFDDFGSGLSSFACLRHLPVDYLEIDGSYVRTIATGAVDRAMVASFNQIGHLIGLSRIAEFVEDDAILQQHAIGVDYAQGCGLRRSTPLADVLGGWAGRARPAGIGSAACVRAVEIAEVSGPAEVARTVEAEEALAR